MTFHSLSVVLGQERPAWYTQTMLRLAILCAALPTMVSADGAVGGKTIDCYCTDTTGNRVELGQTICLQVGGRMFTAQCQMSLNVPMWRELQDGCLGSDAQPAMSVPAPTSHG